ncbi:MAG: VOC family protein [Hyphomicrobiaceae bacterium]|nr:VOC family protein [Hyphomicrobiaceae bacterium]
MEESGNGYFHWNELLTTDVEKAKAFFEATLGWTYDEMDMPGGKSYFLALVNDEPVAGLMSMPAEIPAGTPPHWLSYVEVDDLDGSVQKVERNGGRVLRPPFEIQDVGRIAVIADPSGAVLGLITPATFQD